jgi:hypothetical protein
MQTAKDQMASAGDYTQVPQRKAMMSVMGILRQLPVQRIRRRPQLREKFSAARYP